MKENKKILFKAVAAMFSAFVVLNLICVFYYNIPTHKFSKTNSTDYVWEKNKFYSRGTEGFASGTTDERGFNNLKTLQNGEIDVLIMGSSHMEAFNVAQDKNAVSVLNELFRTSGASLNAYNIGISSHNLVTCLNNLGNAADEFKPKDCIIIETQSVEPSLEMMKKALDGTLASTYSHNEGFISELQKIPYLRLMYSQLMNARKNKITNNSSVAQRDENEIAKTKNERTQLLDALLNKSAKKCENMGIKLIIFYNCEIKIDDKGKVLNQADIDAVEQFKTICEKNDITFVNMYDSFKDNYYKTKRLPRGFSNTSVGSGHLNEEGHRVVAEKLFQLFTNN